MNTNNKHKKTVSVGICAYNEEKNIKNIIIDVLRQREKNWEFTELLIYCDGCIDNTANIVKGMKNKRIKVNVGKKRLGKTKRLNQMLRDFSGDTLILFDADIKLKDKNVITKMVGAFQIDESVMLIGGNSMPIRPKTFFQKAVFSTFQVFYDSRRNFRDGHNVFGCTGSCLGIRRTFAKQLSLPDIVNEDAYIYLACKSWGYTFRYVDNACVHYKLPENATDYIRQVLRSEPKAVQNDLHSYFTDIIKQELRRPILPYSLSISKEFLINPLGVLLMIVLNVACIPFFSFVHRNYSLNWFTADSTKQL